MTPLTRRLNKVAYLRQRRIKLKRDPAAKRSGVAPLISAAPPVERIPDQS